MDKLNKFLNLLYSDSITFKMHDFYEKYSEDLYDEWRCEKKFVAYLKAFYILVFLDANDEMKDKLISNFENNDLSGIAHSAIDNFNAMCAKPGEFMTGFDRDIEGIFEYQSDELFSKLSFDFDINEIADILMDFSGIISMVDIKAKDTTATNGYEFSKDEIDTIEKAALVKYFIDALHIAYDYRESDYKLKCNYDAITDEFIKKFAYHTDKKNPEFKIALNNGLVVNYYEGDIRFYDLNFVQMVNLLKAYFINNYYNGEDDESFIFWLEVNKIDPEDASKPYDEMDDELKTKLLSLAAYMLWEDMTAMLKKFSIPMVKESQKDKEILDGYIKTYRLGPTGN